MRKRYFDQKKEHLFTQSTYGENNTVSKNQSGCCFSSDEGESGLLAGVRRQTLYKCFAWPSTRQDRKNMYTFCTSTPLSWWHTFFFFFLSYLHAYMFSAGEIKDNEIQTRALFWVCRRERVWCWVSWHQGKKYLLQRGQHCSSKNCWWFLHNGKRHLPDVTNWKTGRPLAVLSRRGLCHTRLPPPHTPLGPKN